MKLHACIRTLTLALLISFAACKKGDIGPEGPVGPQGEPGNTGVFYSEWFTASPWIKDTVFSVWGFKYNKAAAKITQPILDSGTVLVFAKLIGYNPLVWPTGGVGQLPINLTYQQGSIMTDTWSALATVGNLRIRFVNDQNYYTSIANTHQFRYIIIPPGEAARAERELSYMEVCEKYKIPE